MTAAHSIIAPTFHAVRMDAEQSGLADPNAPVFSIARDLGQLAASLLIPLSESVEGVTIPAETCWLELLGGVGASSDENNAVAFSVAPDRLSVICADGTAFSYDRNGLSFPQIEHARATDADTWRRLFVLHVGPFLALCALLDAPGIRRRPTASGAFLVERDPSQAAQLRRWIAERREKSG